MGNLHSCPPRYHRKLPAELNREIFLCLKPSTQRKFICGLGWDFYSMFRHRLLIKTTRVRNPHGNGWNRTNTRATVAADGLNVRNNTNAYAKVIAEQPFPISGPLCRLDDFPGTICYYYEIKVKVKGHLSYFGLSDGAIPDSSWIGLDPNSYGIPTGCYYLDECWVAGKRHHLELPEGVIQPRWKSGSNVYGCGIVLDPGDKLSICFTLNGNLLGRKIPINPTVDRLFPTVRLNNYEALEANFGDDPAKPFAYPLPLYK